jgi:hypothetical protein
MKKSILVLALGLVCTMWTLDAQAALTTIDFEAYTDAQNIHGVNLGGVTLYENQLGIVRVYASDRFGAGYKSAVNSVGSDESAVATLPLTGVFDAPTSYVSIWAGDNGGDIDQWELEVFDAGGVSLGIAQSEQWNGNPYTKLSIGAEGIVSFQVRYLDPVGVQAGIAYDDLQFGTTIPAPGAVVLGSIGAGLVGWLRRRRSL